MKAIEFPRHLEWMNCQRPLSLAELKGHVILLDFWIYCCINCMHVLQDLAYLEEKYKDEPFVVIGVHSAKFANERDSDHIRQAIIRYEMAHPVVNDADHELMDAYGITSRPSLVLIGPDGQITKTVVGEGHRQTLEQAIDNLLVAGRQSGTLTKKKIALQKPRLPEKTLAYPGKLAYGNGYLYCSDSNHNRIVELALEQNGEGALVRRTFGSGTPGFRDGHAADACFFRPQGLTFADGNLYVCDTENHAIRRIDLSTGFVDTIAGRGEQAVEGAIGGPGKDVLLNSPWDSVRLGDYLYIAMAGPHQIWRLHLPTHYIEVCAGNSREGLVDGSAYVSELAQPSGMTTDGQDVYFADSETSAIRRLNTANGEVETLVGQGLFDFGDRDGSFAEALLQHPIGLTYAAGNLYVADSYNHALKKMHLEQASVTSLVRRQNKNVCSIHDQSCQVLALDEPNDVLYVNGKFYITDTNNHLIRIYDPGCDTLAELKITETKKETIV